MEENISQKSSLDLKNPDWGKVSWPQRADSRDRTIVNFIDHYRDKWDNAEIIDRENKWLNSLKIQHQKQIFIFFQVCDILFHSYFTGNNTSWRCKWLICLKIWKRNKNTNLDYYLSVRRWGLYSSQGTSKYIKRLYQVWS